MCKDRSQSTASQSMTLKVSWISFELSWKCFFPGDDCLWNGKHDARRFAPLRFCDCGSSSVGEAEGPGPRVISKRQGRGLVGSRSRPRDSCKSLIQRTRPRLAAYALSPSGQYGHRIAESRPNASDSSLLALLPENHRLSRHLSPALQAAGRTPTTQWSAALLSIGW
jgi:hypothetical protein